MSWSKSKLKEARGSAMTFSFVRRTYQLRSPLKTWLAMTGLQPCLSVICDYRTTPSRFSSDLRGPI